MEWAKLLSRERLHHSKYIEQANRSIFMQDYDRIVFSEPFRRLANKTQVQPLYEHDHVHHRLIHSVEVGSVGRSLALAVGRWLISRGEIQDGEENSLANIVQAACAAHDIGNPPFGHSGENAIGSWFYNKFQINQGIFAELDSKFKNDFCKFEGNAQGFRIIAKLEMYRNAGGMRLSKAVLGAFMKYPHGAALNEYINSNNLSITEGCFANKKFGVFNSEIDIFKDVASSLGLPESSVNGHLWWSRHPLVFVVEAADDICYNILDLEDAFTTGELEYDIVFKALSKLSAYSGGVDDKNRNEAEQIAFMRALSIGKSIDSCVDAFMRNYREIMDGTFSMSLIEASSLAREFEDIKKLAGRRIFTAQRKTELEVSGHIVIYNVLSGILPVYEKLSAGNWDPSNLDHHSEQIVRALSLDLRGVSNAEQALHGMTDFMSGMTDRYALRISRMLSGT